MSEYEKLKQKGIMSRGRPRHTPEQQEQSRVLNSFRQEARRRAHLVLKERHAEEFEEIYLAELKDLQKATRQTQDRVKTSRKK
jgi:hypothetical protein